MMSKPVLVMVDVAAWAAIHAATGYLVHRLPVRRFEHDTWLTRSRAVEGDGALYVRLFRVKRWKRWLPEAGNLFAGGYDKRTLRGTDDAALRTYVRETRRAELGHWLAAVAAPLFFLWNPWYAATPMLVYAAVANGPCVISQRYNRLRLARVLRRRAARRGP